MGKEDNTTKLNQATRVVLDLVEPFQNCGRIVTTDNFYTSPELAIALAKQRTYLVGTLRSNKRGVPRAFVESCFQDDTTEDVPKV